MAHVSDAEGSRTRHSEMKRGICLNSGEQNSQAGCTEARGMCEKPRAVQPGKMVGDMEYGVDNSLAG